MNGLVDAQLLAEFQGAVKSGLWKNALSLGTQTELACGEGAINISDVDAMDFYCAYLLCFMLVQDLEGAWHFWRRAPLQLKVDGSQLAAIWNICRCLREDNIAGVHVAMRLDCSPAVQPLLGTLKTNLFETQLQLVPKAYSSISVKELSTRLDFSSDEELKKTCAQRGWEISSNGFVRPKAFGVQSTSSSDDIQSSIAVLERLTSYVNKFDQKNVQIDFKGTSSVV